MDVDPYMPVQEMKAIVLAFAIGCFVLIAILDAWVEYRKYKKGLSNELQHQENPEEHGGPECPSSDGIQSDEDNG